MKIYTKTGDKGTTSLIYGQRVSKTDARVEAYGTCDEANTLIGLSLSHFVHESFDGKEEVANVLQQIQTELFYVGSELATPPEKEVKWKLKEKNIQFLEKMIDQWDEELEPLNNFILPGGHPAGAALHAARSVVRRAERKAVKVEKVNPLVLAYLNRLSDLLFVAARYINAKLGQKEKKLSIES
ncbi:cob(I)yrinic acid a,c-diamide adenosyltransferase [Bacillus smithii]|uniref:cob(I)yrinic acid a,c-diamide adenosyltransferase n=1 Tax=Bacillus smithii TaxID=1479 RepID=UPI0030C98B91